MKTLAEEIQLLEDRALDYEEIRTILAHRVSGLHCKFIDLETFKNQYQLSDILPPHINASIILLTAPALNSRHWTCLIRHKNKYSFFDSLALGYGKLGSMLQDNGRFVGFLKSIRAEPNTTRIQKNTADIKTCSLHVICRLVKYNLTNGQYVHWLHSLRMHPDELVCLLTYIGHLSV